MGRTYAYSRETLDGENFRIESWKENQKKNVSQIFGEVERSPSGRFKLGN
jgi:hypothetical protein